MRIHRCAARAILLAGSVGLAANAAAAAGPNGDHRPPPPPPPVPSDQTATGGVVAMKGGIKMPPPPPPPQVGVNAARRSAEMRMGGANLNQQSLLQQQRPPPPPPPPVVAVTAAATIGGDETDGAFQERLRATVQAERQQEQQYVEEAGQRREGSGDQQRPPTSYVQQQQQQQPPIEDGSDPSRESDSTDSGYENQSEEKQRFDYEQRQYQQQQQQQWQAPHQWNNQQSQQPMRPQQPMQQQQYMQQQQWRQQQQQQQQQRPDPYAQRPTPQQHRRSMMRPSPQQQRRQQQQQQQQQSHQPPRMFRGILSRIEKGIDGLASIEDAVDKRARALGRTVKYATAGKMSVREAAAASAAGSRQELKEVRRAERIAKQAPNMFDLFKDAFQAEQQSEGNSGGDESRGGERGSNGGGDNIGEGAGTNTGATESPFGMGTPWGEDLRGDKNPMAASLLSNGGATRIDVKVDEPTSMSNGRIEEGKDESVPTTKSHESGNPIEELLGTPPISANDNSANANGDPAYTRTQPSGRLPSYLSNDDDDDENHKSSRLSKAFRFIPNPAALLPSWRRSSSMEFSNAWGEDDDDDSWMASNRERAKAKASGSGSGRKSKAGSETIGGVPSTVSHLLGRGQARTGESGFNLLSRQEGNQCHTLGRIRSLFDVAALLFSLVAISELAPYISSALTEASIVRVAGRDGDVTVVEGIHMGRKLFIAMLNAMASAFDDSWAFFALASAFLSVCSNHVFVRPAVRRTASTVAKVVRDQSSYSQMFLRLVAAMPPKKNISEILSRAARSQVWSDVEASRLRSFAAVAMIGLVALTISVAKPILFAILSAGMNIGSLEAWRQWPPEWSSLGEALKAEFGALSQSLQSLLGTELEKILANPMGIVVQASLFVAILATSALPTLVRHIEQKRSDSTLASVDEIVQMTGDDEEELDSERSTSTVLDMGISSSARLSLMSQPGAIEGTLDRWKVMQPKSRLSSGIESRALDFEMTGAGGGLLRRVAYETMVAALLCLPIGLFIFIVPASSSGNTLDRWSTGASLVCLLFSAYSIARHVLTSIENEFKLSPAVTSFLRQLSGTVDEMAAKNSPQTNLQQTAGISSTKGITVTDFWSAHTSKRAWATRGSQLSCQNGEVCLILGDDGSGKSRLLTALAEHMVQSPKKSRSTAHVRGQVSFGGVDISRWDKRRLKRSLGLVLNDVRTLSDTAEVLSGCTLEEILSPVLGGGGYGSSSHNAMQIAMQVTGLSALVERLPSKLSTVVTANEDELRPSPIRPPTYILSPSEWGKVVLTRTIAQTVFSNENPTSAPDAVRSSLVGSILLLDDVTAHSSEIEEAHLIKSLRSSGAAVLLSSNHWASGRFVDRIVVMSNGAVIESGTHADLLRKGPAKSLYAAKWKQMTSNN